MKMRTALFAMTVLVCTLDTRSVVLADPWPQAVKSRYFSSCVTVGQGRWRGMTESTLTQLCNCKLSALQKVSYETFANRGTNPFYLEMYLALPTVDQKPILDTAHENLKAAMHLVSVAENQCASR
jgi:hypothetical protein